MNVQTKSSVGYDTNIFRTRENKVPSQTKHIGLTGILGFSFSRVSLSAGYSGQYRIINTLQTENSEEHNVNSSFGWKKNEYTSFAFSGKYATNYDPRGSTQSLLDPNLANAKYSIRLISSSISMPTTIHKVNLVFGGQYKEQRYLETLNQNNDIRNFSLMPELQYRYSGKTSMVANYVVSNTENIGLNSSAGKSKTHDVFLGTRWRATGKTSGSALVGYGGIVGNNGVYGNSGLRMLVSVQWLRKPYSRINMGLSRRATLFAKEFLNYSVSNSFDVSWNHTFTQKFRASVGSGYVYTQFRNRDGFASVFSLLTAHYSLFKQISLSTSAKIVFFGSSRIDVYKNFQNYSVSINVRI